jgi:S1-C subfamily serine protease
VALDSIVPPQVRNAFGSLRDLVSSTAVPRVFSGFAQITGPDVAEPDAAVDSLPIAAARDSILRVSGSTPQCRASVTGSGFAFGPNRVLTNAHVVAGVPSPIVQVRLGDEGLPATVVYFDSQTDVAVLDVPGLDARPLQFSADPAQSGDSAVIAGFPEGGPFRAEPARVRTVVTARGDDIYGNAGVDREVYVVRGTVLPGNSGGPLLDLDGRVLGMVFGSDEQLASVGYALTAAQLEPAVQASADRTEAVDTGTCNLRN